MASLKIFILIQIISLVTVVVFVKTVNCADLNKQDNKLFLCGVEISKGDNINKIRTAISGTCKTKDNDGINMFILDRDNKFLGNIVYYDNKVSWGYKHWNAYAEDNYENIDSLFDVISRVIDDNNGKLAANIRIEKRSDPGFLTKELIFKIKGKSIRLSITQIKGSQPSVSVDEYIDH